MFARIARTVAHVPARGTIVSARSFSSSSSSSSSQMPFAHNRGVMAGLFGGAAAVGLFTFYAYNQREGSAVFATAHAEEKRSGKVVRVVLTGGPCGGKSSALKAIEKAFEAQGVKVLSVPEVPTLLLNGGCEYPGTAPENKEKLLAFEANLIRMQLASEDAFNGIAESLDSDVVVVYDRGSMDVAAYVTQGVWAAVLSRLGTTNKELFERYDLVVHLVTAADGAVKFYTLSNNQARSETPEQAIELDQKVFDAWKDHPRHVRVDNSTDFKGKLTKVINEVQELL